MVEEAAAEKLQLLKYCHELELRVLAVDMMVQNPPNIAAEHRDAFALLDLQQVSPCQRIITQFSRFFVSQQLAAASSVSSTRSQQTM
jgi:hypothetical protein